MSSSQQDHAIPDALATLVGTVLENRYRIDRMLGSGGMGAVFEARHLRLDRLVAIKVLRPAYATEKEYITRFIREAKSASSIRHRNVVEILDYGETESGLVYSVMEFLPGQDLEKVLRAEPNRRLSWGRACGLLVQIASGLKAAHSHGVIHRDIKPANCVLTKEDGEPVVKLVDFGIAKLEESEGTQALTATSQVLGTPSYIAPELVRGKGHATSSSDIYALGVLAYRTLVGRTPFVANTAFEILRKACFDPVPSMLEQVPELPEGVEKLVMEMLAKDPEMRPANMLEVRDRLLAMHQQNVGEMAVKTPGPSESLLGAVTSMGPEEATVPRSEIRRRTQKQQPPEFGKTDVAPKPPANEIEQGLRQPLGTPLSVAPTRSLAPGVHDVHSAASSSTTTISADYEPNSSSKPTERPHRHGWWWIMLSIAGLLVTVGTLMIISTRKTPESTSAKVEAMPSALLPLEEESRFTESTSGTFGPSVANAQTGPDRNDPINFDHLTTTTGIEDLSHTESTLGHTINQTQTDSEPTKSNTKPRPKRRSKPPQPQETQLPEDSTIIDELEMKISSKCEKVLIFGPVTVKFFVSTSGKTIAITASPQGPAGTCAIKQVQSTQFRTRESSKPFKIKVEK